MRRYSTLPSPIPPSPELTTQPPRYSTRSPTRDPFAMSPRPLAWRPPEAIANDYYRGSVDPSRILLTASTSEAYAYLIKLLTAPGGELLVPRPSYPLFEYLAALESVRRCAWPAGSLERCIVAALAEAHKVTNRPKAKTDRFIFAPFGLPTEPLARKGSLLGDRHGRTPAAISAVSVTRTCAHGRPRPQAGAASRSFKSAPSPGACPSCTTGDRTTAGVRHITEGDGGDLPASCTAIRTVPSSQNRNST